MPKVKSIPTNNFKKLAEIDDSPEKNNPNNQSNLVRQVTEKIRGFSMKINERKPSDQSKIMTEESSIDMKANKGPEPKKELSTVSILGHPL
jgi:hypothetical protein